MTYYSSKGSAYNLGKEIKSGGEGAVYELVGYAKYVAKIYFPGHATQELQEKLTLMSQHKPDDETLLQIAWPLVVLYDANRQFVGFIMPKLRTSKTLASVYKYPSKLCKPGSKELISTGNKVAIAYNICLVMSCIHRMGFIFGDFNPNNIGVNLNDDHVAFFDTDSYHIPARSKTYRCTVALPGYVAPELAKKCKPYTSYGYADAALPTFTKETDNFALAIHIFKLLMNGFSPFDGIRDTGSTSQASPGTGNEPIVKDMYCFKQGNKPRNGAILRLYELSPAIQALFTRTFIDGVRDPSKRATPEEWMNALLDYQSGLIQCKTDLSHYYYKTNSVCPYCAAYERYVAAQNAAVRDVAVNAAHRQQMSFQPIAVPPSSYVASVQMPAFQSQTVSQVGVQKSFIQPQGSLTPTKQLAARSIAVKLLKYALLSLFIMNVMISCGLMDKAEDVEKADKKTATTSDMTKAEVAIPEGAELSERILIGDYAYDNYVISLYDSGDCSFPYDGVMHYGSYTTDGALLHMESSEPTSVSVDAVGINGKMLYYEGNEYVMQAE